jgi:hypothetical protein
MKTFNTWLEAIVSRRAIPFDQDDIDYLHQVDSQYWSDALKKRYNDFLMQAAIALQEGHPIQDIQSTTLQGIGRRGNKHFELNTGMTKLVKKLQDLGFDLSDPQPASSTLGSMSLMSIHTARTLLRHWREQSPVKELLPGFSQYVPNKLQTKMNSMDDPLEAERIFAQIKPDLEQKAQRMIYSKMATLSDPDHPQHINFSYWNERKDELLQAALQAVKDNLKDPPSRYWKLMNDRIGDLLQTGHVSRRKFGTAKQNNIDINDLLRKGHTPQQISTALHTGPRNRYTPFTFNIEPPPNQPQQDLKNIYQSVPSQSAPVNKYGDKTLSARRKKATDRILQGKDSSYVGNYALAPTESFKNWLEKRA